jgi:hypothetical protein
MPPEVDTLPRFPRLEELLATARTEEPLPDAPVAVATPLTSRSAFTLPVQLAEEIYGREHAEALVEVEETTPISEPAPESVDETELIASLTLRDTAREALRARLIGAGRVHERRSAHELVFLMLAFAVMVLVTAPPLVRLAYALHGTQVG